MKRFLLLLLTLVTFLPLLSKGQLITNTIYGQAINAGAQYQPIVATATLVPPYPLDIQNYQVVLDGYSVYADTNGNYTFTNLQAGNYSCNLSGNPGLTFLFGVYNSTTGAVPISSLFTNNLPIFTNGYPVYLGMPILGSYGGLAVEALGITSSGLLTTNVPGGGGGGSATNAVTALYPTNVPLPSVSANGQVGFIPTNYLAGNLQRYVDWNIPVPTASWDAAVQPNNGSNSLLNATLVDDFGNVSNTLIPYPTSTLPAWEPNVMNGQPGFSPVVNQPWSNNIICWNGVTNFTIFIVYRDIVQADGNALFGSGPTNTFGFYFAPSAYGIPANYGCDSEWTAPTWTGLDLGRAPYVHIASKQNKQVQCAAIRVGGAGDPTIWQDGVLMEPVGLNVSVTTYLTNLFVLAGTPLTSGYNNFYGGWIGEAKYYNSALSDADMQRLMIYYRNRYNINNRVIILGSDSITAGCYSQATSNLTQCLTRLMPTYEIVNNSIEGIGSTESYTNLLRCVSQGKWPAGSFYVDLCGANDPSITGDELNGFVTYTNFTAMKIQACLSNGISYIPVTHYSTVFGEVTYPGFRTNVNNWIYTNWYNLGCAGIVDLAADPRIGPLGSYTNGLWINQADQEHLVTNAYPVIYAPAVSQLILSLTVPTNAYASTLTGNAISNAPGFFYPAGGGGITAAQATNIVTGMTNALATGAYTTVNNGATADTNQIIKFTTNQLSSGAFTTVGNIATLSSNTVIGMAGAAVGGSNYLVGVTAAAASTNFTGVNSAGAQVTVPWAGLPAGGGGSTANTVQTNSNGYVTINTLTASNLVNQGAAGVVVTNPADGSYAVIQSTNGGFQIYAKGGSENWSNQIIIATNGVTTFTGTNGQSGVISNGVFYGNASGMTNTIMPGFVTSFPGITVQGQNGNCWFFANGLASTLGAYSGPNYYNLYGTRSQGKTLTNFWFTYRNAGQAVANTTNIVVTWYTNNIAMTSLTLTGPLAAFVSLTATNPAFGAYIPPWTYLNASITNSAGVSVTFVYGGCGYDEY